ncbi:hypothetical protein IKG10_02630 [Candidatus Saccharibacteria bacterium]|nr:hypothetical protein [Candidatus Saccharibacteria bacterium]
MAKKNHMSNRARKQAESLLMAEWHMNKNFREKLAALQHRDKLSCLGKHSFSLNFWSKKTSNEARSALAKLSDQQLRRLRDEFDIDEAIYSIKQMEDAQVA